MTGEASPKDRHVVITGGGSGIGAAVAERLGASGIKVTLMGRRSGAIEATAAKLSMAQAISVDITDEAAVMTAFQEAVDRFGPVTVLVNSAGGAATAPFERIELARWQSMLDVNLTGTFLCTRAVLAGMRERGWGRIVNVASTAGLKGYGYVAAYCAAKHGVIGLTRSLALETARDGITVNAVCPGYTDTDLVDQALDNIAAKTGRSREQALSELVKVNPQRRLVSPAEVAATVAWLCGPDTGAMTGQAIAVAGGEVM